MEENKKTMEVEMNPSARKETGEKGQKLTYEQLNQACAEMHQQIQNQNEYLKKLYKSHQELAAALQAKRLDYLFKVVELANSSKGETYSFDEVFVSSCIREIEDALTVVGEDVDKEAD